MMRCVPERGGACLEYSGMRCHTVRSLLNRHVAAGKIAGGETVDDFSLNYGGDVVGSGAGRGYTKMYSEDGW